MKKKFIKTLAAILMAAGGLFSTIVSGPNVKAYAASGTVYTCTINRCYAHPVTGQIEDSGGQAAYATGQGMVESCIGTQGIVEVTDSGEVYVTFRMSLMDYTSSHSFWYQTYGGTGWSTPSIAVTGTGSDSNGTTKDIRIKVSNTSDIIRCSMYVEPMGRSVIFYVYASNLVEGTSSSFNNNIVTVTSKSTDTSTDASQTSNSEATTQTTTNSSSTTNETIATDSLTDTLDFESVEEEMTNAVAADEAIAVESVSISTDDTVVTDKSKGLSLSCEGTITSTSNDSDSIVKIVVPIVVFLVLFVIVGIAYCIRCGKIKLPNRKEE